MMFHRDTGLLTIDISGANGWGLYCEMSLHPAYNSDLFRWHAISGPGSDLNGAMTFDPATLIHFFVVPPITEVPPNTAVIELSADPGNANGDWEFRKLMLTPFQV